MCNLFLYYSIIFGLKGIYIYIFRPIYTQLHTWSLNYVYERDVFNES